MAWQVARDADHVVSDLSEHSHQAPSTSTIARDWIKAGRDTGLATEILQTLVARYTDNLEEYRQGQDLSPQYSRLCPFPLVTKTCFHPLCLILKDK